MQNAVFSHAPWHSPLVEAAVQMERLSEAMDYGAFVNSVLTSIVCRMNEQSAATIRLATLRRQAKMKGRPGWRSIKPGKFRAAAEWRAGV